MLFPHTALLMRPTVGVRMTMTTAGRKIQTPVLTRKQDPEGTSLGDFPWQTWKFS